MIGKVGGSQQISIGNGCTSLGTVTHEMGKSYRFLSQVTSGLNRLAASGHALGFYHEQSRYDRDSYVTIVSANIQNGYLSQFTKQSK